MSAGSGLGAATAIVATCAIAAALVGMLAHAQGSRPAPVRASSSAGAGTATRAELLTEQRRPQRQVPFDPAAFDKFAGYYHSSDSLGFAHVYRSGSHYFAQLTGQPPVEFFPESRTEFFATVVAAQISFVTASDGQVTGMVVHQNGYLSPWPRSSKATYEAFETGLRQRIRANKASPGTEAAVRRQLEELEGTGHALYAAMTAPLATAAREQSARLGAMLRRLGPLSSLHHGRVLSNGDDDYLATFARGQLEVIVAPLSADGKIAALLYRPLP